MFLEKCQSLEQNCKCFYLFTSKQNVSMILHCSESVSSQDLLYPCMFVKVLKHVCFAGALTASSDNVRRFSQICVMLEVKVR